MMASDWEISKTTGRCAITHRAFSEGEAYFAALFETPEGPERRDYAVEAWTTPPPGCFCYWRARVPVREEKANPVAVDHETLIHLFCRLEDEESEMKQQFRFVLALLLMRKRRLKFQQRVREGEREYWQMRLVRDDSIHRVLNPRLTDEEVERLGGQLTAILSGEVHAIESLEWVDRQKADVKEGESGRGAEGERKEQREAEAERPREGEKEGERA